MMDNAPGSRRMGECDGEAKRSIKPVPEGTADNLSSRFSLAW